LETKEEARIGTAVVDKRLCVSHNGTGACGASHTICPVRNKAITQGIRCAPTVHEEHCTGCGMCEEVCIVRDRRAIQVKTVRTLPGVVETFDRQVRDRDAQ
jgi:Pyruvate/2-oxoacid:ferredoxin oxidoreductase delta subunit